MIWAGNGMDLMQMRKRNPDFIEEVGRFYERIGEGTVAPSARDDTSFFDDLRASSVENTGALLSLCGDVPALRALLARTAADAPFLRDLMRADAGRLLTLVMEAPEARIASICNDVLTFRAADEAALMTKLRRARADVALTVALADLGGVWSFDMVVCALSAFADTALQRTVDFCLQVEMDNGKLLPGDPQSAGYCVLAMGKFGARELNYSSDIDLIVLFDPDKIALPDPMEATRVFVNVTKRMVKILQERTGDGYVFRVDLRLRPDPGSTSLALSTIGALNYYESAGQNWERAAMIKARPVAGDLAVGAAFLHELHPFVWRKYLDYSAIADVHSIKRQIHIHKGHGTIAVAGHNIKLGRGGIREIEFFVQTQQLIAGGRNMALRGRETLEMLAGLAEQEWITPETATELAESLRYLRSLEHRIQMLRDEQTHVIPEEPDAFAAIAAFSGHSDPMAFETETRAHLERVQYHYSRLFEEEPSLSSSAGSLVFTGDDDDPETLETLERMGFSNPRDIAATIRGWHTGRINATRTKRAREHLTKLVPVFLNAVAETRNADAAFSAFDRFIGQLPAGIQLFSLLRSNPSLLNLLMTIMGAAPRLARTIVRRAHILDSLLDPEFFGTLPERSKVAERLRQSLADAEDYEEVLNRARIFGQEHIFLIGVRIITGTLPHYQAGQAYALLADVLLEAMFEHVCREFETTHGRIAGGQTVLLALGKLGGMEMTAASDLDLILLYNHDSEVKMSDGHKPLAPSQYYIRLTKRFIAALSAPTGEGTLYQVDFRLRPSGNAGPLATHISSFDRYQHETAWVWEHMALTRARIVFGEPELRQNVLDCICGILCEAKDREKVRVDVAAMRARIASEKKASSIWEIKTVAGGLIDIEFIAQFIQLVLGPSEPEILDTNTNGALYRMQVSGVLEGETAETLMNACRLYESLTQVLRLSIDGDFDPDTAPASLKSVLATVGEMPDFATLEAYLAETQASVRTIFERVVGEAGELKS